MDLLSSFPEVKHADCRVNSPAYLSSLHLLNNAWMFTQTGFINADGTFGLFVSKNSINNQNNKVIPQAAGQNIPKHYKFSSFRFYQNYVRSRCYNKTFS